MWIKLRNDISSNFLLDTVRSVAGSSIPVISSDSTNRDAEFYPTFNSFNSNGFSLNGSYGGLNANSLPYVSWTFRKAPKFFDVVTYTGNGTANRQIAHSLGIEPGMINTKSTSTTGDWNTYHRSATGDLKLNTTDAQTGSKTIVPTASTTTFTVSGVANTNGVTYVAYLYAHDPAPDGKIQCGSFTTRDTINLGWEPQFVIIKASPGSWYIQDSVRGMTVTLDTTSLLKAESSNAEVLGSQIYPTSNGFTPNMDGPAIYCAIRRPNKPPVSSASVYKAIARTGTGAAATVTGVGFAPDAVFIKGQNIGQDNTWFDRLRGSGKFLNTDTTDAEISTTDSLTVFGVDGISLGANTTYQRVNGSTRTYINHFFRRAPGFFDVVAYTGTGVARTVPHNLGVVPEMMIVKDRSNNSNWYVWNKSIAVNKVLVLNGTDASYVYAETWNSTAPTESVFSVRVYDANELGRNYVWYGFATLPGISKVGSYTGTGAQLDIDAGFATGPAFLLIKRTDSTGDWYLWDSTRGIVSAGNDPYLLLNSTAAEVTNTNYIDPINTGFRLNATAPAALNASGGNYIYYSVAKP